MRGILVEGQVERGLGAVIPKNGSPPGVVLPRDAKTSHLNGAGEPGGRHCPPDMRVHGEESADFGMFLDDNVDGDQRVGLIGIKDMAHCSLLVSARFVEMLQSLEVGREGYGVKKRERFPDEIGRSRGGEHGTEQFPLREHRAAFNRGSRFFPGSLKTGGLLPFLLLFEDSCHER
jgi:hypothetical protein